MALLIHLTLEFLGEQPIDLYREICESLESVQLTSFELEFEGVGFFGSKKVPRTLWADVRSSRELIGLQKKVCKRIQELGIKVEAPKFRPHLTLARLTRTHPHPKKNVTPVTSKTRKLPNNCKFLRIN